MELTLTLNTAGPIGLASLVTHGKVIVGSVRGSRVLERTLVEPHDACSEAAGVELRTLAFYHLSEISADRAQGLTTDRPTGFGPTQVGALEEGLCISGDVADLISFTISYPIPGLDCVRAVRRTPMNSPSLIIRSPSTHSPAEYLKAPNPFPVLADSASGQLSAFDALANSRHARAVMEIKCIVVVGNVLVDSDLCVNDSTPE